MGVALPLSGKLLIAMAVLAEEMLTSRLHSETESCDDEDDVPLTQPVEKPLAGVMAFVDVRLGTNKSINTGKTISAKLDSLGAIISTRLTKDVTHIVFKDGKTNLDRIDTRSVFIVSPLWVESCNRCNEQVSEAKYPVVTMDTSIGGGVSTTPVVLGKIKRIKSMQPKPFVEAEVTRSVERNRKRPAVTEKGANKSSKCLDPFEFVLTDNDSNDSDETPQKDLQSKSNASSSVTILKKPTLKNSRVSKIVKKKTKILKPHQQKIFIETEPCINATTPEPKDIKRPLITISERQSKKKTQEKENQLNDSDNHKMAAATIKVEGYSSYGRKKRSSFEKRHPGIVITSLEPSDRETVLAVINSLGRFEVSKYVNEDTTHVVCGAGRRTVNALAGTAKGCWLLSVEWVWNSLEAGKWSSEEAFEMVTEFPAAQFFRLEHQQAGLLYRPSLFHKGGSIYVSQDTKPPSQELEMLLNISGAKITGSKRKADICIGLCRSCGEDTVMVSEQWVIDSISEHKMLSVEDYAIDSNGSLIRLRADSPEL